MKHAAASDVGSGLRAAARCQLVVLVHGLSAKRLVMWPIQRHFARAGYQTLNWGYRSTTRSTRFHAGRLAARLRTLDRGPADRIHIVAHSMGAIVVRAALQECLPAKLGRVVMLAPPNRGSFAARWVSPLVGWCFPTMAELSDRPDSYVNRLAEPAGYEFGVIAASRDRVIARSSVGLPGAADFVVVSSHHGVLPWHSETCRRTQAFIEWGSFG